MDSFSSRRFAEFQNQAGYGRLYQQILLGLIKDTYSKRFFTDLNYKFTALADQLYALRRLEELEQLGKFFLSLPLGDESRIIGRHYQALCLYQKGKDAEARAIFEYVAEQGPIKYRARALLGISGMLYDDKDSPLKYSQSITEYCVEASRLAVSSGGYDYRTIIESQRNLVLLKSIAGDHRSALADLERLFPLVRNVSRWHPDLFCSFLNSFAVELGEVGRIEEALRVADRALASPYARIYRQVQETRDEIVMKSRRASRSVVAVSRKAPSDGNVLSLPMPYRSTALQAPASGQAQGLARVFDLQAWKYKLAKEAKATARQEKINRHLSAREMLLRLMDVISEKDLTEDQLAKMLEAVEKIAYEPKGEIN
jgi:tetratricopeptide (TPR) repeat protein